MTTAQAVDLRRTRRAVFGGSFGFFVDMFDVYLPTVALAPAISYFTPKDMPTSTRGIVTALIFVATLLGRPIGSAIFGMLADKVGGGARSPCGPWPDVVCVLSASPYCPVTARRG